MRKVTYGAACSLDGFITGPNGEIDWLHFSPDVSTLMTEYLGRVDTVLMGRKTWEVANAMPKDGAPEMPGVESFVFSRSLAAVPSPARLVTEDAGDFVRALKRREGKEICLLGGGELARSLLAAGVVDEVGLNIHPVLLGSGTPFFRDAGRIRLELRENRPIAGGCVYVIYRVIKSRKPRGAGR